MDLEVFAQGGGVGVGLVAAAHSTIVRLVRGVHVHVLLTVARVGKLSVASFYLTLERFFTWTEKVKMLEIGEN